MQKSRLHVLAATVVCATALVVAGCAAAAVDEGGATRTSTSARSGSAPGQPPAGAPVGDVTTIGGVRVSGADGYAADSAPITERTDAPEVANLDADLRRAVIRTTEAAAADGVEVRINSGWRSTRYQQALLDQAVEEHGSLEEARRWVNTPERSAHVRGGAVDVGEIDAAAWMQEHGSEFGLCQTYENESWHYELSTTPGGTCPAMRRDSSEG
ncbi:M15 family metallopeptidase [Curtobacterium sp. MCPF17_002]|uniref:M15 family metallopeptidase n=1 Tax=Curtobacterium sp. MCPF17_002 TaxID=2175645 RepID=UPI000DA7F2F7|nr:M15 family metallopeptidase [Curtobacterium sp. MCPF17_002]WIB77577.1 M15 family metallopeptidase [Curtobacterium sp. MCPF17_002]